MKLLLAAVLSLLAAPAYAGCSNASAENVLLGSGCEVIISTNGTQTVVPGAGGLSVTASLIAADFTAASYSSAPIVYTTTIAVTGQELAVYGTDGARALVIDADGGTRGLRVNIGSFSGTNLGNLEIFDTGDPTIWFRRNDNTTTGGEFLGGMYWRDNDSSTGGTATRMYDAVEAYGSTWSSGQTFEIVRRIAVDTKAQSEPQDVVTIVSTGVYITHSSLGSAEASTPKVVCATCTLQVVSPAGSGLSVVGNVEVSGVVKASSATLVNDADENASSGVLFVRKTQTSTAVDYDNMAIVGYAKGANSSWGYATGVAGYGNYSGSFQAAGVLGKLGTPGGTNFYNGAIVGDGNTSGGLAGLFMRGNVNIGSTAIVSTATLRVAGSASITENLHVGSQVAISTPNGGNGNLRVRAGTGNGGGTTPITLFSWAGSSTTQGTVGLMKAAVYTMPANTIVNVGDTLQVYCVAVATTANLSKHIRVTLGGDDVDPGAVTTTSQEIMIEANISYKTAGVFVGHGWRMRGTSWGSDLDESMAADIATDLDISCDIKGVTAVPTDAGDEDMELLHMRVVLYPAP